MNSSNRRRREAGFTLIELLVVVLIIGILASIAIPQYFKVVERAKVAEAHSFITSVKSANERRMAREGTYVSAVADIGTALDISFSGSSPAYGMKNYSVSAMAGSTCGGGDPGYTLTVARITANSGVSPRYGAYTTVYDRCTGLISYPSCTNCDTDFK